MIARPNSFPLFSCEECADILNELSTAGAEDGRERRRRAEATAADADRDPKAFVLTWVKSVAEMPEQKLRALLAGQYPRAAAAIRKKVEHEAASGHSVWICGWRSLRQRTDPSWLCWWQN